MEYFTGDEMRTMVESPVTGDMLERWRCYLNAFPLPPHLTPIGGRPLATVEDESLMNCPPHLISHIQRTAAQGGLQVISPRQTPFSGMMVRRSAERAELGDYEVGSISNPNDDWPTVFDSSGELERLLPDEPLAPLTDEVTSRPKTRSVAIVKGHNLLCDPVLACLIKGRAVIDIQKRDDVCGGAEEMAELLAQAWGISIDDIMELDAYTLGLQGDLQRHAIRSDDVYPTIYAATHIKSVISAGVSDLDKGVLPPDTALDWRRMRVFCECVFYNACMVEGLPIKYMKVSHPPGAPGTSKNRKNMLVFGPAPATAWVYSPETFSVIPTPTKGNVRSVAIPSEVRSALQMYADNVRPVSFLLSKEKMVEVWRSAAAEVTPASGETLADSYSRISRTMTLGSVRGRHAAAAVRNAIYEVVEHAPLRTRTRLVRILELANVEARAHLGLREAPDVLVHQLAIKMSDLGVTIRERLVKEAERRGSSIEEWWEDILAQAPGEYTSLSEGTFGWAKVGMWTLLKAPTDKWHKLKHAMKMSALSDAAVASVGGIPLPAKRGSIDRLVHACRHAVKQISTSFSGYYQGVADVGFSLAKTATDMGKPNTAGYLAESAAMWSMRSRALRGVNVSPLAHEEVVKSVNHILVEADPVNVVLKPAPYTAYRAWANHVAGSSVLSQAVKKMVKQAEVPDYEDSDVSRRSSIFQRMNMPVISCRDTLLTRYVNRPQKMAGDLEKAWKMLSGDVAKVVDIYVREMENDMVEDAIEIEEVVVQGSSVDYSDRLAKKPRLEDADAQADGLRQFWDIFGDLDPDTADGIQDQLDRLPDARQEEIMGGDYRDFHHLLGHLHMVQEEVAASNRAVRETVK